MENSSEQIVRPLLIRSVVVHEYYAPMPSSKHDYKIPDSKTPDNIPLPPQYALNPPRLCYSCVFCA